MAQEWDEHGNPIAPTAVTEWDEHGNPITASSESSSPKTLAGFASNILPSAGNLVGNLYQAVRHPIDTVSNLADTVAGVGNQGLAALGVKQDAGSQKTIDKAVAVENALKKRYGSVQAVKDTFYNDPVGAASDLSVVLGGGSAALRGASTLADTANAARLASGLRTASKVADVASTVANPATLPAMGTGMAFKAAARPFIKNALRIPGKAEMYGADPVDALLSGKVKGNTPKSIAANSNDVMDSAEAGLQNSLAKAQKSGTKLSLKPARDVVNQDIAEAEAAQGTPSTLYPLQKFVSEVRPNSTLATEYPIGSNTPIAMGQRSPYAPVQAVQTGAAPTPIVSELQDPLKYLPARRRLAEEFTDFYPTQNPFFKKPPEQSAVANRMVGAMGNEIKTKIPETVSDLKTMQDVSPLRTAARKIQEAPGQGQVLIDKFSRNTGALAPILYGLAKSGVTGGLTAAMIQSMAASPTAKILAGRSLYGMGNVAKAVGSSVPLMNTLGRYRSPDEDEEQQ